MKIAAEYGFKIENDGLANARALQKIPPSFTGGYLCYVLPFRGSPNIPHMQIL